MTNLLHRKDKFITEKWQICYREVTNLLQRSDKFVAEKWQIYYREVANLLQREDKFVTVHNECSKTPTSASVQFAVLVRTSRVVCLSWSSHVSLCRQQHLECERAIPIVRPPFFRKLRPSSNPTNENVTELGLEGRGKEEQCAPESNSSVLLTIRN